MFCVLAEEGKGMGKVDHKGKGKVKFNGVDMME